MYLSLLIFPEHQNKGFGTKVLKDIINKKIPIEFESIEVSINDDNFSSLHLFEKVGLIDYKYKL